jgi:beta-glucanase (GH16 family)
MSMNRLIGLNAKAAVGSLLVGLTAVVACTSGAEDPSVVDNVGGTSVGTESVASASEALTYTQDFFDGFDGTSLNGANWQDQYVWVNNEGQCYDNYYNEGGQHKTVDVSGGSLKLRVVDSGSVTNCDNWDKNGAKHPNTRYKGGRIASKNRKEFARGRFTARLKLYSWTTGNAYGAASGLSNMFPAWWLLGYRNNENPVQESNENVCWPMAGSGEIDIFEHYGSNGGNKFTARVIKNLNYCNGGDWQTYQISIGSDLSQYHEYQVDYADNDVIYRVDNVEKGRNAGQSGNYAEPMFMILNYAINGGGMAAGIKEYAMDIDWVKHESASGGGTTTNCNATVCCSTGCKNASGAMVCGGTGCGSLPGGAGQCCTTEITNSGVICNGTRSNAPCKI